MPLHLILSLSKDEVEGFLRMRAGDPCFDRLSMTSS
jgi:hypothetical protein